MRSLIGVIAITIALVFMAFTALVGAFDTSLNSPSVSPMIVQDDSLSPVIGSADRGTYEKAYASENPWSTPFVGLESPSISPLIAQDDTLAPAWTGSVKSTGTFMAEVVGIDHHAKMLKVATFGPSVSPLIAQDDSLLKPTGTGTNEILSVLACNEGADLHSIAVGDRVNISYQEKGGEYIALLGNVPSSYLACNLE